MRLVRVCAVLWAALVAYAQAQSDLALHPPSPVDTPASLKEDVRKTSSAGLLPGSSGAGSDEVATLKQQISGLRKDKKGLVIAVRRLLKANQTEAQHKMLSALRGAKLHALEAAKKSAAMEQADKMQIAKLQQLQHETDDKLKQQTAKLQTAELASLVRKEIAAKKDAADAKLQAAVVAGFKAQLANDEAALVDLRKKGTGVDARTEELEAKVTQLKAQKVHFEDENMGLQSTVQKLWNVNASAEKASMLNMLAEEDKQLKALNATKVTQERQFAQEKNDLSWKLSDRELKLEVDAQAMDKLKRDNQQLHEDTATVVAGLKEQNKKLAVAILKERKKGTDAVQAAQKSVSGLKATILQDLARNERLQKENQNFASQSAQSSKDSEKTRLEKASVEHAFAQELIDLQRKVNETNALAQQKEAELQDVKKRGIQFFGKQWEKTEKSLKDKIVADERGNAVLEAKLADLTVAQKQKDTQIADLTTQDGAMHNLLKKEELKLSFAVDKENTEMAHVDKLEAESKELKAALQKEKQFEPRMVQLLKHDQDLQSENRRLVADEKNKADQLKALEETSGAAVQTIKQTQSKLDFAVDQENTEMLAVKILQGENQKLKETLQNQTELQAELVREQYEEKGKLVTIQNLNVQNSDADKTIFALKGQVAELTRTNGLLEDQYAAERTKMLSMADQDSTASLALKVLQGENQKLKRQLEQGAEEQAEMVEAAKQSQVKVSAAEDLVSNRDSLQRELASLHIQQDAMQLKNDQLKETVVSMAGKAHDGSLVRRYGPYNLSPRELRKPKPVQEDGGQINGLEQASSELSKLMTQLHDNNKEATAKMEADAEADDA